MPGVDKRGLFDLDASAEPMANPDDCRCDPKELGQILQSSLFNRYILMVNACESTPQYNLVPLVFFRRQSLLKAVIAFDTC